jgi:hypothetical protein
MSKTVLAKIYDEVMALEGAADVNNYVVNMSIKDKPRPRARAEAAAVTYARWRNAVETKLRGLLEPSPYLCPGCYWDYEMKWNCPRCEVIGPDDCPVAEFCMNGIFQATGLVDPAKVRLDLAWQDVQREAKAARLSLRGVPAPEGS